MIEGGRHFVRNPSILMHHTNERPVFMVPVRVQDDGIEHEITGHLLKGRCLLCRVGEDMRDRSQDIFDGVVALTKLLGTVVAEAGTSQ